MPRKKIFPLDDRKKMKLWTAVAGSLVVVGIVWALQLRETLGEVDFFSGLPSVSREWDLFRDDWEQQINPSAQTPVRPPEAVLKEMSQRLQSEQLFPEPPSY
ncbi:hypothetical protein HY628_03020 [Candidatus Uhrbacteria bacterium]|nr:hypothetical protein [Candidatus Uhrbacteria bacterium]